MKSQKETLSCSLLLSYVVALLVFSAGSYGADWPNWRGPNYNGISAEKDWDPLKVKDGIKPLWQSSVGIGFSTLAVSDGKLFAMGNVDDKDIVYCFDAETGKEIWTYSYPQELDPKYYEGGSLASPVVDGNKVYTVSKDGKAFCFEVQTGKVVWNKDVLKDFGITRTTWGTSGSPLVVDDLVIYNVGSKGAALNKNDGSVVWKSGTGPGGYATAVPFTSGNKKCVAIFSEQDLYGLVAATGDQIWRHPWKTKHNVNAADPIFVDDNTVFVASGYGNGCGLLKISAGQVTEVWRNKNICNKMNGSVLWKGHIYGVDEKGELKCLNYKTGGILWSQQGFGQGSLMLADGKLIVLGETGNLVIAQAVPEGYKVLSEAKILSGRCWSVPVLANGRIYARNAAGTLVCLDVSTKKKGDLSDNDWPQWRGSNRDDKSAETGLLKKWPEGGPKLLWSVKGLGVGFSTVSISDGLIYTTGLKDERGFVFAYDFEGRLKWETDYGREWTGSNKGVRTTPTVNNGKVYVISGYGTVACLDAKTGKSIWSVDTAKEFGARYPKWGISESPLIVDDKLICTTGGENASFVALNKNTGEKVWTTKGLDQKPAFCSPLLIKRGDKKIIVNMIEYSFVGIDADNGKLLWDYDAREYWGEGRGRGICCNTPIYQDGYLFFTSGYDMGAIKFKLSEDGTTIDEVWKNKTFDCHHGGVVLLDGYLYGSNWLSNSAGNWVCVDWSNGEVKYEKKWLGKGAITYADGMLYCYEEDKGTVALVKPTVDDFDIVSSFAITKGDGRHWAHPVVCKGRLYVRHGDVLMAYDIQSK